MDRPPNPARRGCDVGAQGVVSKQLEAELTLAEAKDILLDKDVEAHDLSGT